MREAELLKAKTVISQLKNETAQMDHSRKRARIEYEKEMVQVKQEHQVKSYTECT